MNLEQAEAAGGPGGAGVAGGAGRVGGRGGGGLPRVKAPGFGGRRPAPINLADASIPAPSDTAATVGAAAAVAAAAAPAAPAPAAAAKSAGPAASGMAPPPGARLPSTAVTNVKPKPKLWFALVGSSDAATNGVGLQGSRRSQALATG